MSYINAADYDSLEEAIERAYYRRLYLPIDPGNKHPTFGWFPKSKDGIKLDRPIEIFSDGPNCDRAGMRYFVDPVEGTKNSTIFRLSSRDIYIHDLTFSNDYTNPGIGTGDAISFTDPEVIHYFKMNRCGIFNAGRCGIRFAPIPLPNDNNFILVTDVDDVAIIGCGGRGVDIQNASTTLNFRNVNVVGCGSYGFFITGMITSRFDGIVSENNCQAPIGEPYPLAAIYIDNSWSSVFRVHIENFANNGTVTGIHLSRVHEIKVECSGIYDGRGMPDLVGVRLTGGTSHCVVEPQHVIGLKQSVSISSDSKYNTIFRQTSPISPRRESNGNVYIGS